MFSNHEAKRRQISLPIASASSWALAVPPRPGVRLLPLHHPLDRTHDPIVKVGVPHVLQHERTDPDGADRIRHAFSSDIGADS
jgi:hypothetical protein